MKPRIFSVGSLVIRASPVIEWSDDEVTLSIKSIFRECSVSRGSAHEIDFATQNHKNREHVSRFLYSKREKVSAWELSDVRVLRSQNTSCRKNVSFSTVLALLLAVLSVLGILLRLVLLILLGLVLLFLILIAFHNGFRLLILKFRS